jgi:hypothetical protein
MKTIPFSVLRLTRSPLALAAAAALLVLSACGTMSTIEGRSKEKAATFSAAAPWQQKLMRSGWIDAGFTTDMVYIALDKPDKKATADNGATEIWIYNNFDAPARAFNGGVKVTIQAGSALGGQGNNPNSAAAGKQYLSAGVSPDLSAANVDPISNLYVVFREGKVTTVNLRKE